MKDAQEHLNDLTQLCVATAEVRTLAARLESVAELWLNEGRHKARWAGTAESPDDARRGADEWEDAARRGLAIVSELRSVTGAADLVLGTARRLTRGEPSS